MIILVFMLLVVGVSIFLAIKKQRPAFLSLPVLALITYVIVEIALVPAPFLDTVKFIFSLQ
ncbi:hypothetical protein ACWE42_23935 [Sutcliffiella cohnii]|uniref:Uncharacterized protein n=1 Tax=Sutcliffiella cohnii TaxID=33932 RepID=A0A223KWE8_9BACI|nr:MULTISPECIES: hypothetical protein [Sutcliffiella]AST93713.1 hypothetical protein BC6307_21800 [Sutcliffiella cohnii]MED4015961.1 hypothetical protein [Sutcliffiella cohnii]WBL14907.1 hypothetical protein O1A01_24075 [Sutcliffiella sp. NC1]